MACEWTIPGPSQILSIHIKRTLNAKGCDMINLGAYSWYDTVCVCVRSTYSLTLQAHWPSPPLPLSFLSHQSHSYAPRVPSIYLHHLLYPNPSIKSHPSRWERRFGTFGAKYYLINWVLSEIRRVDDWLIDWLTDWRTELPNSMRMCVFLLFLFSLPFFCKKKKKVRWEDGRV